MLLTDTKTIHIHRNMTDSPAKYSNIFSKTFNVEFTSCWYTKRKHMSQIETLRPNQLSKSQMKKV